MSNEIGYLAEEISKQSVEEAIWCLLNAHSKVQEARNDLKVLILMKKDAELKNLENSYHYLTYYVFYSSSCLLPAPLVRM